MITLYRQFLLLRSRSQARHNGIGKKGFTLLELLLVVVILSATAWMLTATITNDVSQVRYDDTRNRLTALREAILGPSGTTVWERGILSGYVADNGVLPEDINALVAIPTGYQAFEATAPTFDGVSFPAMMKGHRGAYVAASAKGFFRDGWGNARRGTTEEQSEDQANHGWKVTLTEIAGITDAFSMESYGMDGKAGTTTGNSYEEDIAMTPPILSDDWQINLSGGAVRVVNLTNKDIGEDAPDLNVKLKAYLLVFENRATGGAWRAVPATATSTTVGLDGNADGACGGKAATREASLIFPVGTKVPIGEHLLILAKGATYEASAADTALDVSPATGEVNARYISKRIKFFSRGGIPDMVLEIR